MIWVETTDPVTTGGLEAHPTTWAFAARWRVWFAPVLAVSAALRLVTALEHGPVMSGDTADYLLLAHRIGRLDLRGDLGQRVPLYPLSLVLLHYDLRLVQAAQLIAGLLVTSAIFWIVLTLTRRPGVAAVGAAMYGWNLAQIRIESTMLSETLATLLVTVMGVALVWLWSDRTHHVLLKLVVMALCAGLLPLDRTAYAFVPIVACAVAFVWARRPMWRVLIVILIAFTPMLAWSTYNAARADSFGLSTGLGLNLTNKTGLFVADAPQKYALDRDLYLQALAEDGGENVNAIWRHYPSMMAVSGESFNQLSGSFMRMDIGLIVAHPGLYGANASAAFFDFFRFWGGWPLSLLGLPRATDYVWRLEAVINAIIGATFLALVVGWVCRAARRRAWRPVTPLVWLALIVLTTDVICAAIEFGDSPRFGLPTQPLMIVVVVVGVASVVAWPLTVRRPGRARAGVVAVGDDRRAAA